MKKRSSWVWFYFKRLSSNLAQCKLCRKNLHSCNSTGNLSRHLKIKHKKFGGKYNFYFFNKEKSKAIYIKYWTFLDIT